MLPEEKISVFPTVILVVILLAAVIAAACFFFMKRGGRQKDNGISVAGSLPGEGKAEPIRSAEEVRRAEEAMRQAAEQARRRAEEEARRRAEEENARRELTAQYVQTAQEVDRYEREDVYRKAFARLAPLFQTLLGLLRRYRKEGMADDAVLSDMRIALQNANVRKRLTPEGYSVTVPESAFDAENMTDLCMKLDIATLRQELDKKLQQLRQHKETMDCKRLIMETGKTLYVLQEEVDRNNVPGCLAAVEALNGQLEAGGCHAIYVDHPLVMESESMRVDFRDDVPSATELPGLYTLDASGTYHLIGVFGGTMRVEGKDDDQLS